MTVVWRTIKAVMEQLQEIVSLQQCQHCYFHFQGKTSLISSAQQINVFQISILILAHNIQFHF